MPALTRIIKKYANRRLYDTTDSRYVTLANIRAIVADGADLRVIEEKSGDDVTRAILVQIVSEQEVMGQPILSEPLLRNLIRYYDNPLRDLAGSYLEQSFSHFDDQRRDLMQQWRKMLEHSPLAALTDLAQTNHQTFQALQKKFFQGWLDSTKDQDSSEQK